MKTQHIFRNLLVAYLLLTSTETLVAQAQNNLLSSIRKEVDRNKSELKMQGLQSPFYLRYTLSDIDYLEVCSSNGALIRSYQNTQRSGIPFIMIGSFEQNDQGYVANFNQFRRYGNSSIIPIENNPAGIANAIWADMDKQYKSAAELYEVKQSALKMLNRTEEEKNLPDYEKTAPVNMDIPPIKCNMDKSYWENYVKKASAVLKKYPELIYSDVTATFRNGMLYYYDTENSSYTVPNVSFILKLNVSTRTEDGQELSDDMYIEYASLDKMPEINAYTKLIDDFTKDFLKLRKAPMIDESYSGPVLFEEMALAEAVHQHFIGDQGGILAKKNSLVSSDLERYAGNNFKGNDFEGMINKKVISRSLSLKSLSGTQTYNGKLLDGYFVVDAEGVAPAKELSIIENGVLKNMLNGRTPTKKTRNSNGHMRYNFYNNQTQVSPGNILLASSNTCSESDLKKKLIEAAKEETLEYAYIIRRMRGNSPIAVYKIYVADGREELVRGAILTDFNIKSFKRVLGAANTDYFYNLTPRGCLTTVIVPKALLFEEMEISKNNGITLKTPYIVPQPK